ncbi:uncharacterized protein LOC144158968 [Haemaphysalis longicornis]
MATALCKYDYSSLPYHVWLRILSYADTDALLAIEATAPCFSDIVRDERLLKSIVCTPSSDERTLRRFFLKRVTRNVKVLDVSNCIVAAPDVILSCVGTCPTLTELRCVNCPLPYSGLLMVLVELLPNLQRLDWSFFGNDLSGNYMRRFTAQYNERAIPQLRSTYVEVACQGADNHALLSFLLQRCIRLQKLHLHALYGDFTEETAMCVGSAAFAAASDPILVFSAELDALRDEQPFFTSQYLRLLQLPSNCSDRATVGANLVFLTASTAGDSSPHTLAIPRSVEIARFKQVVVALRNDVGVETRLMEAAIEMTWTHIEALTLFLVPYSASSAGPAFRTPLISFLNSFRVLTELNLNSFHFTSGMDCCHILAAVPMRLRALSLAPCGINRKRSFRNLAKVSSQLEELDVRMNCDILSVYCPSCSQPFRVRGRDAAILQQSSSLRRFTLFNVVALHSLDFVANLRTYELRLSFMANWCEVSQTYMIRNLLRCKDDLRSLVLRDSVVSRDLQFYQEELDTLRGLYHLSLDVSTPCDTEKVGSFLNHMTARLPVLKSLHLHYVSGNNCVRTLTWLREPAWHRETSQADRQSPGALLVDRQCIGCSMATFIGLAKPRNRRQNCL